MKSFFKKTYPYIQHILIESQYVFYINLTEKIVFFIFFLLLARGLDKSTYGLITTVFAFSNILGSVFDMGFGFYFQREADSDNINEKLNSALVVRLLFIVVFVIIIYLYLYFSLWIDPVIIAIVALLIYINGFNFILNSVLFGKKKYKKSLKGLLISRFVFVLLITLFYFIKARNYFLLVSLLISVLYHLVILYKYCREENIYLRFNFNSGLFRKVFYSSAPIGLGIFFVLLYDRIDVLIIQRILSFEAVAVYSIAYSFYKLSQIISSVILTPAYTNLSSSFGQFKKIDKQHIIAVSLLLLIISVVGIIIINLAGGTVINFLYGNKYSSSIPFLNLLAFAIPGLYFNNFTGVISNSIRKEKIPMRSTGFAVILNISLNIILVMKFGIMGAVIATIVTEYFVFFFQLVHLMYYVKHQDYSIVQ